MKYKGVPIHDLLIYKHPLIYLELVVKLLIDLAIWFKDFFFKRFFWIIAFITIYALITQVPFLHVNFNLIQPV